MVTVNIKTMVQLRIEDEIRKTAKKLVEWQGSWHRGQGGGALWGSCVPCYFSHGAVAFLATEPFSLLPSQGVSESPFWFQDITFPNSFRFSITS